MKEIYFITSNPGKFEEVYSFFEKKNLKSPKIKWYKAKIEEPRGKIEDVAVHSVKVAYSIVKKPVFVEDTGLFIPSLNGFPGEFSAWVVKKIGIKGILKLLSKDRKAYFKTVIAFNDGKNINTFVGICRGSIAKKPRGKSHSSLPYDSIFIPKGSSKTFAEDMEFKEKKSHRIKALEKFYKFLKATL